MRRVPSSVTVANPFSRNVLRCCETAGWVIPNSPPTISTIAPEESS